jgi:serine palmitoyltransferase
MEGSMSPAPAILALKNIYGFTLLVDEAHSFMSIGSAGRGTFNRWQDLGYDCPYNGADLMTFTFSKGVSSTGGFALANGVHAEALLEQSQMLASQGVESLPTIVLLRFLSILKKPRLVEERMRIVLEKSEYVASKLKEAGLRVLAAPGSPMICFPVGKSALCLQSRLNQPHSISEKTETNDADHDHRNRATDKIIFQGGNGRWYGYDRRSASSDAYVVRSMNDGETLSKLGNTNLPIRGCRIRLCIFASTTWPDIYRLLRTTISASLKIKVNGARHIEIDESLLDRQDLKSPVAASQSRAVDAELLEYIKSLQSYEPTITHQHGAESEVKEAAIEGLQRYSVGPGSARWFWGTFDIFVALEQRLGKLYPSVNKQSGKTKGRLESRSIVLLEHTAYHLQA